MVRKILLNHRSIIFCYAILLALLISLLVGNWFKNYTFGNWGISDHYKFNQTRKQHDTSKMYDFIPNVRYPQYYKNLNLDRINDWDTQKEYLGNLDPEVYVYSGETTNGNGNVNPLPNPEWRSRCNSLLDYARKCPSKNIILAFNREFIHKDDYVDYKWSLNKRIDNPFANDIKMIHKMGKKIYLSMGGWFSDWGGKYHNNSGESDIWNLVPSSFILSKLIEDNILYYGASGLDIDMENDITDNNGMSRLCQALKHVKKRLNMIHYSFKIQFTLFGPSNDTTGNYVFGHYSVYFDRYLSDYGLKDCSIVFMNNQANTVDKIISIDKNTITGGSLKALNGLWINRKRFPTLKKIQDKFKFMHKFGICIGGGYRIIGDKTKSWLSISDAALLAGRCKTIGLGEISIWSDFVTEYKDAAWNNIPKSINSSIKIKDDYREQKNFSLAAQLINLFQARNSWLSKTQRKFTFPAVIPNKYYQTYAEIALKWENVKNASFYGVYLRTNDTKMHFLETVLQSSGSPQNFAFISTNKNSRYYSVLKECNILSQDQIDYFGLDSLKNYNKFNLSKIDKPDPQVDFVIIPENISDNKTYNSAVDMINRKTIDNLNSDFNLSKKTRSLTPNWITGHMLLSPIYAFDITMNYFAKNDQGEINSKLCNNYHDNYWFKDNIYTLNNTVQGQGATTNNGLSLNPKFFKAINNEPITQKNNYGYSKTAICDLKAISCSTNNSWDSKPAFVNQCYIPDKTYLEKNFYPEGFYKDVIINAFLYNRYLKSK